MKSSAAKQPSSTPAKGTKKLVGFFGPAETPDQEGGHTNGIVDAMVEMAAQQGITIPDEATAPLAAPQGTPPTQKKVGTAAKFPRK